MHNVNIEKEAIYIKYKIRNYLYDFNPFNLLVKEKEAVASFS